MGQLALCGISSKLRHRPTGTHRHEQSSQNNAAKAGSQIHEHSLELFQVFQISQLVQDEGRADVTSIHMPVLSYLLDTDDVTYTQTCE